jgi:predicted metal-dependent HD superfamily phosphohydrolase
LFESLKNKLQDHNAIRFAIWFHDAVYDTKKSDNEEKSADFAAEILSGLNVNLETIDEVRGLISATKDHSGKNLSEDAKFFLDMDLAILGVPEAIYGEYSKAIRAEYAWVPAFMYRRGRKKILKSFIERERIYYSDEMQARFETQARMNIAHELASL